MPEKNQPPAPPVGAQTSAPELEPTIRDHVERLGVEQWKVGVIVARLHGEHDAEGKRRFPDGVSLTTRMGADDFEAAIKAALHGRV
jgi:hypothetical protein